MTPTTVLVCGDRHRGDDAAALVAADRLAMVLPDGVALRRVGQLGPDHLIAAMAVGRCLVLDAVRGIEPGSVISRPLGELATGGPTSASSHALPLPTTIALAEALGANIDRGTFMGIGGETFELGVGLSPHVVAALDDFVAAVTQAITSSGDAPCA